MAQIEAGLSQRVRAWNLFLRDIYSGQEILKAGVGPVRNRLFRSQFSSGLRPAARRHGKLSSVDRFDLQQDVRGNGSWWRTISAWLTAPVMR